MFSLFRFATLVVWVGCSSATPSAKKVVDGSTKEIAPVFDLSEFPAFNPFADLELHAEHLRDQKVRKVIVHTDDRFEDKWLRDKSVTVSRFNAQGQVNQVKKIYRGKLNDESYFRYEGDRMVSMNGKHEHQGDRSKTFEYSNGVLTRIVAEDGAKREYKYDEQARIVEITDTEAVNPYGGYANVYVTKRSYEGKSLVEEVVTKNGQPFAKAEYVYRSESPMHLSEIAVSGHRKRTDIVTFEYDEERRVAKMEFREGDKPIYTRTYKYDDYGRIKFVKEEHHVPALGNGKTAHYEYELEDGSVHHHRELVDWVELEKKRRNEAQAELGRKISAAAAAVFTLVDGAEPALIVDAKHGGIHGVKLWVRDFASLTDEVKEQRTCKIAELVNTCGFESVEVLETANGATHIAIHFNIGG